MLLGQNQKYTQFVLAIYFLAFQITLVKPFFRETHDMRIADSFHRMFSVNTLVIGSGDGKGF